MHILSSNAISEQCNSSVTFRIHGTGQQQNSQVRIPCVSLAQVAGDGVHPRIAGAGGKPKIFRMLSRLESMLGEP